VSTVDRQELDEILDELEAALTEHLDAAEEEVNNKIARLKAIKEGQPDEEVEEASTAATLEWYGAFESFFFPAVGG